MTWNSPKSRSKVGSGRLRMSMPESKTEQSKQKPYPFNILISEGISYHLYHNIFHRKKKALNAAIIQGTSIIKVYIRDHFKNVYYKVFFISITFGFLFPFLSLVLIFYHLFFFISIEWLILQYTMHYIP